MFFRKKTNNFTLLFLAVCLFSSNVFSQAPQQESIILHVHYMSEPDDAGRITGPVDLQVHNASGVPIDRVQIEPSKPHRLDNGNHPAQVPTLGIGETAVVFSSVNAMPISNDEINFWQVIYYINETRHEKRISGLFINN